MVKIRIKSWIAMFSVYAKYWGNFTFCRVGNAHPTNEEADCFVRIPKP